MEIKEREIQEGDWAHPGTRTKRFFYKGRENREVKDVWGYPITLGSIISFRGGDYLCTGIRFDVKGEAVLLACRIVFYSTRNKHILSALSTNGFFTKAMINRKIKVGIEKKGEWAEDPLTGYAYSRLREIVESVSTKGQVRVASPSKVLCITPLILAPIIESYKFDFTNKDFIYE